jgi:hypothetical protein
VRVGGGQVQPVDRLELVDLLQRIRAERGLALEGVQDDALDQITQ